MAQAKVCALFGDTSEEEQEVKKPVSTEATKAFKNDSNVDNLSPKLSSTSTQTKEAINRSEEFLGSNIQEPTQIINNEKKAAFRQSTTYKNLTSNKTPKKKTNDEYGLYAIQVLPSESNHETIRDATMENVAWSISKHITDSPLSPNRKPKKSNSGAGFINLAWKLASSAATQLFNSKSTDSGMSLPGQLFLTQHFIRFVPESTAQRREQFSILEPAIQRFIQNYWQIPMSDIFNFSFNPPLETTTTNMGYHTVTITWKLPRYIWSIRLSSAGAVKLRRILTSYGNNGQVRYLVSLKDKSKGPSYNSKIYSPEQDYIRLGIRKSPFTVTTLNSGYKICSTYPKLIVLPNSMNSEEIKAAANYRRQNRMIALAWYGGGIGSTASLWRSSQPRVGFPPQRCKEDEKIINSIAANGPMIIIDLRDHNSALVNQAGGGGTEDHRNYTYVENVIFADLPNIHIVRGAYESQLRAVLSMILPASSEIKSLGVSYLEKISCSEWSKMQCLLLKCVYKAVKYLHFQQGQILIHCSDGWDRTAQIAGLIQLCIDPYYRTGKGLVILIEKEFIRFGYQMRTRHNLGIGGSNDFSPVLVQWLEAVFNLTMQFITSFEFNSKFLVRIAELIYSPNYATFFSNTELERCNLNIAPFLCAWDEFFTPSHELLPEYINKYYVQSTINDKASQGNVSENWNKTLESDQSKISDTKSDINESSEILSTKEDSPLNIVENILDLIDFEDPSETVLSEKQEVTLNDPISKDLFDTNIEVLTEQNQLDSILKDNKIRDHASRTLLKANIEIEENKNTCLEYVDDPYGESPVKLEHNSWTIEHCSALDQKNDISMSNDLYQIPPDMSGSKYDSSDIYDSVSSKNSMKSDVLLPKWNSLSAVRPWFAFWLRFLDKQWAEHKGMGTELTNLEGMYINSLE